MHAIILIEQGEIYPSISSRCQMHNKSMSIMKVFLVLCKIQSRLSGFIKIRPLSLVTGGKQGHDVECRTLVFAHVIYRLAFSTM